MKLETGIVPAFIKDMTPGQVQQFVFERITGRSTTPLFSGDRGDERPEDVIVDIFRAKDTAPEVREAVVFAMRTVAIELMSEISGPESNEADLKSRIEIAERWANVLDRAAPLELKAISKALLQLAKETEHVSASLADSIMRAALGYRLSTGDIELWEQLLTHKEFCAYAYNALLKIDPLQPRLLSHLTELWKKRINEGWRVNAPLLTARTIRAQGGSKFVSAEFVALGRSDRLLFNHISEEMRYSRINELRDLADNLTASLLIDSLFHAESLSGMCISFPYSRRVVGSEHLSDSMMKQFVGSGLINIKAHSRNFEKITRSGSRDWPPQDLSDDIALNLESAQEMIA